MLLKKIGIFFLLGILLFALSPLEAKQKKKSKKKVVKKKVLTLKEKIKKTKISLNFRKTSLFDAISFFRALYGVNFYLSPQVIAKKIKVTATLNNISIKDALSLILKPHKLTYTLKFGAIIIHKKRKNSWVYKKLPKKLPSFFSKQKISLRFNNNSLVDVIQFCGDSTGKNFVISPKINENIYITINISNVSIKSALALMLFSHKLTYSWKNGVVYIEKAKKNKAQK